MLRIRYKNFWLAALLLILSVQLAAAQQERVSISLQSTSIHDVMKMLSMQQRLNIFVSDGVEATVSVNLYDMWVPDAIHAIAEAAGLAVEERNGSYFIVERDEVGKYNESGMTETRAYKVQYSDPTEVEGILSEHLSTFGNITVLDERKMLVVEDQPQFLQKIEKILATIDREPRQILIEAKIMEVRLSDGESFGIDWSKAFDAFDGSGSFGTQGLGSTTSPGLFFQFLGPKVEIALNALRDRGRLRTLATPKLLAMEDREAEAVVGQRLGYRVTTTINQVTSESVEFLETGIILKVTPSVDRDGMILMDIAPEVSDGDVSPDGLPSKTTTQLETRMLVPDGQTVFLGGLIRRNTQEIRDGVPVLGDLPGVGALFSNKSRTLNSTEIVVLITPKLIDFRKDHWNTAPLDSTAMIERELDRAEQAAYEDLRRLLDAHDEKLEDDKPSSVEQKTSQVEVRQADSPALDPYAQFETLMGY